MRSSTLVSPADLVKKAKRENLQSLGDTTQPTIYHFAVSQNLAKTAWALAQVRFWFRLSCGSSGRGGTVNMV